MWRKSGETTSFCPTTRMEVKGERERGGRRTKGRMENCKRWERRLAVGRKNRGSALVKEIIRGLIKYRAQLVLLP